jgi:hypothetical protein
MVEALALGFRGCDLRESCGGGYINVSRYVCASRKPLVHVIPGYTNFLKIILREAL